MAKDRRPVFILERKHLQYPQIIFTGKLKPEEGAAVPGFQKPCVRKAPVPFSLPGTCRLRLRPLSCPAQGNRCCVRLLILLYRINILLLFPVQIPVSVKGFSL